MKKDNLLQSKMFSEMKKAELFRRAESFGLNYLETVFDRNVYPSKKALDDLSKFEEEFPENSQDALETLNLLHEYGAPGTTTQIGGRYFGFVHGGIIPVGLAAKNLATFWDQNASVYQSSPISAKLETVVQKWLVQLFDLPSETIAGFVSGTSMANFCALAAARYRILKNLNWDVTQKGLYNAPPIRVVTCKQAHSSMLQAISLAGFGTENIEFVDVDDQGRILVDNIPKLDNTTILSLQAGNVNSGAFDDFESICKKAKDQGVWIHIDGAFGLWAGATQKLKHLTSGYEYANSWAVDAHKTLNAPYDSGIIFCSDEEALISSLHINAAYLPNDNERNGMYYAPEMSRRSRVIELWATLRYLGRAGVEELVYGLYKCAVQFADLLNSEKGFQVLNHVVFNQVLVRCETDELTDKVLNRIQEMRECWVGGSTWEGHKVIRISVCSWATTEEDVYRSVESFKKALKNTNN
jgi:glutamate/tyrosine decarboxylase-like PLP-dependent enzyme